MRSLWPLVVLALVLPGCASGPLDGAPPRSFEAIRFDVAIDATHNGVFTVMLFPNETPKTAALMRNLVTSGYYDGREFTRIIPGFVVQQVDRSGGMSDSPERVPLEAGTNVSFSAGAMGIARGNAPESGGPEFFIMDFAYGRALYGNYTAWGQVVEGLDVVHAIARVPSVRNPACAAAAPANSACFVGAPDQDPFNRTTTPSTFDQEAVNPAKITTARMVTFMLPANVADMYPLQVAPSVVLGALRLSFEYPHNLAAGRESTITWYVWNPGASDPPPDLAKAYVVASGPEGNSTLSLRGDPADARILHAAWTPPTSGNYTVTLRNATTSLASADVAVP